MNWELLYTRKRIDGSDDKGDQFRTPFERDYDRLIFSSAFRRLQNKTQVFPLPGSTFVHNRLTHTLEVSSVGRSLGNAIGNYISTKVGDDDAKSFYKNDLKNVVASGCLAHDIGNPSFGHSGEDAISKYFIDNSESLSEKFNPLEWKDLSNFEGNANALRIVTNKFKGKSIYNLNLTLTTLATFIKYPCCSSDANKEGIVHFKKYGYFQSEKETFEKIVNQFKLPKLQGQQAKFKRHPFVYILEAADDIANKAIDIEDAHRIGIFSYEKTRDLYNSLISCLTKPEESKRVKDKARMIEDENDSIAYLRGKAINALSKEAVDCFKIREQAILNGDYDEGIIDEIKRNCPGLKDIDTELKSTVYVNQRVLEIELAGFTVLSYLLSLFIPAILRDEPTDFDKKLNNMIPEQFKCCPKKGTNYQKALCVIDYITGMTDSYATELYKRLKGIQIANY